MTQTTLPTSASRKNRALGIPALAATKASQARATRQYAIQDERKTLLKHPEAKAGQQYKILRGNGEGSVGKLVWWGKTKWGTRYMLAVSDNKLPNGRYADVVYARPSNILWLEPTREARREALSKEYSELDSYEETVYRTELLRLYNDAAKEWGFDLKTVLTRTAVALREELNSIDQRLRYINENSWACDGPAYTQVERENESLNRKTKTLNHALALIEGEIANAA
jgi:hypothetical protein